MHDPEQKEQLERVAAAIEGHILAFWNVGPRQFHVSQLLAFVRARAPGIAPDSPGRVLRNMRQHKMLNYKIVNRRQSLYEVTPLQPKEN